jgi:putative salt-induced outer membrane protein YdiY
MMIVVVGGAGACAHASDPATAESSSSPMIAAPNAVLEQQLFGQEIFRLPPVTSGSTFQLNPAATPSIGAASTPAALTVPPAETFPAPPTAEKPTPPTANIPLTLPGISLLDGSGTPPKPPAEKLWDGNFSLGLDGSEGNTDTFNFHFGLQAKRKTTHTILSLSADYLKQDAHMVATANRLYTDGRFEYLLDNSRWSCFVHDTVDCDQFQAYNVLDTADTGLGYRLIKNDNTVLIGRFGGGYSHYYGGPDNGRYFPEAVFSVNLEQQISKRQKLLGTVEYAPDVSEFTRYRIRTQAALETVLDEERHMSMKIGVLERYTSLQQGSLANDFDYAVMIMWKF